MKPGPYTLALRPRSMVNFQFLLFSIRSVLIVGSILVFLFPCSAPRRRSLRCNFLLICRNAAEHEQWLDEVPSLVLVLTCPGHMHRHVPVLIRLTSASSQLHAIFLKWNAIELLWEVWLTSMITTDNLVSVAIALQYPRAQNRCQQQYTFYKSDQCHLTSPFAITERNYILQSA